VERTHWHGVAVNWLTKLASWHFLADYTTSCSMFLSSASSSIVTTDGHLWYFSVFFIIVVFSASIEAPVILTRLSSWLNWPNMHSASVPAMMPALVRTQTFFISQRRKHHLQQSKVITVKCNIRPVFGCLPVPTWLVCKHGSHVTNIPKADWSSVKNKQLTATPC